MKRSATGRGKARLLPRMGAEAPHAHRVHPTIGVLSSADFSGVKHKTKKKFKEAEQQV